GVTGTAVAWATRATVELALLGAAAERRMPAARASGSGGLLRHAPIAAVLLLLLWACGTMLAGTPIIKLAVAIGVLAVLAAWEWGYVLEPADRRFFAGAARRVRELAGY